MNIRKRAASAVVCILMMTHCAAFGVDGQESNTSDSWVQKMRLFCGALIVAPYILYTAQGVYYFDQYKRQVAKNNRWIRDIKKNQALSNSYINPLRGEVVQKAAADMRMSDIIMPSDAPGSTYQGLTAMIAKFHIPEREQLEQSVKENRKKAEDIRDRARRIPKKALDTLITQSGMGITSVLAERESRKNAERDYGMQIDFYKVMGWDTTLIVAEYERKRSTQNTFTYADSFLVGAAVGSACVLCKQAETIIQREREKAYTHRLAEAF